MNNPIDNHSLIDNRFTFRPDLPVSDDWDSAGGIVVVAPGMEVVVCSVFTNWNGVPGLDMLYVYCDETGLYTHVTPADLGLPAYDMEHRTCTGAFNTSLTRCDECGQDIEDH